MSFSAAAEAPFLWALGYRLLGDAADADEVVQETFLRALEHPPPDPDLPWRPWLVRIAANLARDRLRARRRRGYVGPWLPSPVPDVVLDAAPTPEGRYGRAESARFAFLLALEALTPTQRLVVVLRDVFELDAAATATALGTTAGAVRVAHRRARLALADYDAERAPPPDPAAALGLFSAFLHALQTGDVDAASRLLTPEVVALNDGGGRYQAARVPVVGRGKVLQFHLHLARGASPTLRWRLDVYNGAPALVGADPAATGPAAPAWVMLADLTPAGQIDRLYTVLADPKLVRVERPVSDGPTADA